MESISEILPFRAAWHYSSHGPSFSEARVMREEDNAMSNAEPRQIMTSAQMLKIVSTMAKEIYEKTGEKNDILFMGIRTRGVPLAEMIAKEYSKLSKKEVQVGCLDINLYRDDLSEVDHQPVVRATELPEPIQNKGVILIDDVLFTGRTIRAALDALVDFGRPKFVHLAVLIDRGMRELPIQPDYVGKVVKTKLNENVKVKLESIDGENEVLVITHQ